MDDQSPKNSKITANEKNAQITEISEIFPNAEIHIFTKGGLADFVFENYMNHANTVSSTIPILIHDFVTFWPKATDGSFFFSISSIHMYVEPHTMYVHFAIQNVCTYVRTWQAPPHTTYVCM